MTSARVHSAALTGITGHIVTIDAGISNGPPVMTLAGLPDTMLREARDRVRAAVINSGLTWPHRTITVGLSPASLPKRGSGTDLAIAIAVLTADGSVPGTATAGIMFFVELGLDGLLRPVPGTVPAVIAAAAAGLGTVIVAETNAAEAAVVPGVRVLTADRLAAVTGWLRSGDSALIREVPPAAVEADAALPRGGTGPDLAGIPGQELARRALEICAAGGHHLSLTGPPGTGAALLAERLPGIMPSLDHDAALEVTGIRSAAGLLTPDGGLITRPPFIAPHHTASKAAILGGGPGTLRPGAASLAHRGVLFLDQATEFNRDVLDALRQPLETGEITLVRSGISVVFPATFILVLAANPCPCAKNAHPAKECDCTAAARRRYLGKLSGPLLDQVDVKAELRPADPKELVKDKTRAEPSYIVAGRVAMARERASVRLAGTPWRLNTEVPGSELRREWPPDPGALANLEGALDRGQITARGVVKVIRVAWTIADLAGQDRPGRAECDEALGLWLGAQK